jgi:hypothetical protein
MKICQSLEALLLKNKTNVAYLIDKSLDKPCKVHSYLNFTLLSNMDIATFQERSLFTSILSICSNLGLNINCTLPYTSLALPVYFYSKIVTIGQLEGFLSLYTLSLTFETEQDLICLKLVENNIS